MQCSFTNAHITEPNRQYHTINSTRVGMKLSPVYPLYTMSQKSAHHVIKKTITEQKKSQYFLQFSVFPLVSIIMGKCHFKILKTDFD